MKNELAKAGAALVAVGVASLVQGQQFGPCPIGYVIEEVPFSYGTVNYHLANDGTAIFDGKIFRPGVGAVLAPASFHPFAMNSDGIMVGKGRLHLEVRTFDDVLATIASPSGIGSPRVSAIGETGYSVGYFYKYQGDPSYRAFRITPEHDLEMLEVPGDVATLAYATNASGQACGRWDGPGWQFSAFWDSDGTFHAIPIPDDFGNNEAVDIDDQGNVLIFANNRPPSIWSLEGGLRTLDGSDDEYGFAASSMNNSGHAVGWLGLSSAWVWTGSHYSVLENSLVDSDGWSIGLAMRINDAGQIIGSGFYEGRSTLFFAHPVGLCAADLTTTGASMDGLGGGVPDGEITGTDLSYYVNTWIVDDVEADLTTQNVVEGDPLYGEQDGIVTGADIQYFVNMWISGCAG